MSRVLVLLATHNGAEWIEEQVRSVLQQTAVEVMLVVGDDCSSDETCTLISKVAADTASAERISVIRFDERSGGAGQNFIRLLSSVDVSRFDYVAFCDQDDVWAPEKLDFAVERLSKSVSDGYSSSVRAFWQDGREVTLSQSKAVTEIDYIFEGAGQGCTFVVTRELASRAKLFAAQNSNLIDKVHYHDWLVYCLARAWGYTWFFDQRETMRYRQHGGNDTGARGGLAGIKKRLSLIWTGWYRAQVQCMIAIAEVAVNSVPQLDASHTEFRSLAATWSKSDSVSRRFRLAKILFGRGRRRLSDRVVLGFSAVFGWI
ncbi:glycosyltransferase [Stenotrophomonas sp.]|uniref:glycosyltransferase n=1 Tax=Stenotrophomonas sp. TaxID=69392 RepID=UPI0028A5BBEB|nr:glycosyltransferase [Stenotrophomonas sp.]